MNGEMIANYGKIYAGNFSTVDNGVVGINVLYSTGTDDEFDRSFWNLRDSGWRC